MTTASRHMTPHEIVTAGFESLVESLGPGGAIQFMLQYERGKGDYTQERTLILKHSTLKSMKKISCIPLPDSWQEEILQPDDIVINIDADGQPPVYEIPRAAARALTLWHNHWGRLVILTFAGD